MNMNESDQPTSSIETDIEEVDETVADDDVEVLDNELLADAELIEIVQAAPKLESPDRKSVV